MKKLFARVFGWLCGVSPETRGAGLGRGINRGSQLAHWKKLAGIKGATVVLVLGGPASAGNYGENANGGMSYGRAGGYGATVGRDNFGGIPDLGIDRSSAQSDAGWSLGQMVGGWFNSWRSDRTLHDANTLGATGLAGGGCCSSDRLGTGGSMRSEPGPGGY